MSWCASSRPVSSSLRWCTANWPAPPRCARLKPRWRAIRLGFITSAGRPRDARPLRMPTAAVAPWCFPGCSNTCWDRRRARSGATWPRWSCSSTRPVCVLPASAASGRGSRPTCAAPRRMSSMIRTSPARSITRSARPTSTTSPPPRRCRSSRGRATSSISATTIMSGGPSSMPPAAASSPGSRPTRRFTKPATWRSRRDRACSPTASASCPHVRRQAATTQCNRPCVRSW